jgi:hypothetical protein
MSNIIIAYKNEITQVAGSTSAVSLNDYKSQTQSIAANTPVTLTVNSISSGIPVVVTAMLAYDLSPVTLTVTGYSPAVTDSTTTSINTSANPGYGGIKYISKYLTTTSTTTSLVVSFNRAVNVSKFIVAKYWSPIYNIPYGINVEYNDQSTYERLQSGDQYITHNPRHKLLNFDLSYIAEADKYQLFDIIRTNGRSTPIFVSAFPNITDKEKEQMYSIYGRFVQLPNISHFTFTMYSSSIQLEEI